MRYHELDETTATVMMRQQSYYHGTPHDDKGSNILKVGIVPGNTSVKARGRMIPVLGRAYLTPNLKYGVIYCIGGNMLGSSHVDMLMRDNRSQHGWLFVISGTSLLNDIQPDEDSVGEAAMYANMILNDDQKSFQYHQHDPLFQGLLKADRQWLTYFRYNAKSGMTTQQWQNAMRGEVSAQASGGKRFLRRANDNDKLNLIAAGAHLAYLGNLVPDQAWRFDKMQTPQLAKDASNFFALAERVR